jgi:hypothetical protein
MRDEDACCPVDHPLQYGSALSEAVKLSFDALQDGAGIARNSLMRYSSMRQGRYLLVRAPGGGYLAGASL